jgi:hypothetical protein
MEKERILTNEKFIYGLIFAGGLFLRLLLLGDVPLMESEASWAFQAWQILQGEFLQLGSQVAYLSFTEAIFQIFGSSEFQARLWPALVGSLIIWGPFFFRARLGRVPALLIASGLAIDPALVTVSRLAGGSMPSLVFLFLAAAAFDSFRVGWSLMFLILGLFSGPDFWIGALITVLFTFISRFAGFFDPSLYLARRLNPIWDKNHPQYQGVEILIGPLLVAIIFGSFFFRNIQGLSAWTGSLADFFSGWIKSEGQPAGSMLLFLGIYNPLVLLFGMVGFYQGWKMGYRPIKFASIWFLLSLLLILIYPSRQAVDLIWLVIPLWASSVIYLKNIFQKIPYRWVVLVLAGLIAMLIVLIWLTFTGMVFQLGNQRGILLRLGLMGASLALAGLSMIIVSSEWDWRTAHQGISAGCGVMLLLFSATNLVQGSYLRYGDPRSIWSDGIGPGQTELLLSTIGDLSIAQTGRQDSLEGGLLNGSDSMKWALRDLKNLIYLDTYQGETLLPFVLTSEQESIYIPAELYRGQDFVSGVKPGWSGPLPDDWISWIAFRYGPIQNKYIILWVRGDVLFGEG